MEGWCNSFHSSSLETASLVQTKTTEAHFSFMQGEIRCGLCDISCLACSLQPLSLCAGVRAEPNHLQPILQSRLPQRLSFATSTLPVPAQPVARVSSPPSRQPCSSVLDLHSTQPSSASHSLDSLLSPVPHASSHPIPLSLH